MSEYLSKKAVLEWFGLMHMEYSHNTAVSEFIESGIEIFESGAFDADTSEIQRLRAALEEVHEELKTLHFMINQDDDIFHERKKKYLSIIDYVGQSVAGQALSTTTEPTDAAKVERFECPCCGCEISINAPEGDGNDV